MKAAFLFGYFITFIYCSELSKEAENSNLESSDKLEKIPQDDKNELRKVPLRYRSNLVHDRNMIGLRNILIKVRAERQNKRNSEIKAEESV